VVLHFQFQKFGSKKISSLDVKTLSILPVPTNLQATDFAPATTTAALGRVLRVKWDVYRLIVWDEDGKS
jgi:hypothetical protein